MVLYHLKNMRSSHLYNKYVNPENGYIATTDLAKKYQYASHLGDQVCMIGMYRPGKMLALCFSIFQSHLSFFFYLVLFYTAGDGASRYVL